MHPDLDSLVKFQSAETEFRRLEVLLAEIPVRRRAIAQRQDAERAKLEDVRSAVEVAQKSRKQLEASVQDLETRRSKYKGQLMEVKTNKEYTAMLHEIEAVEKEIRAKEDQILADMERLEGLAAEVRRAEGTHKETEATLSDERKAQMSADIPLGRVGSVQDVAALLTFLMSEDAGYITAATYDVNGGLQIS